MNSSLKNYLKIFKLINFNALSANYLLQEFIEIFSKFNDISPFNLSALDNHSAD